MDSEDGGPTGVLPAPLIPADVDLRDFEYMPLDVRRLRDSRLVAMRTPDEILAAILLWCAAWHQVPCGSLPSEDRELAQLAGFGRSIAHWKEVKDGAMHGLMLCSDGRFYHHVIVEKAAESWNKKLDERHKRACDRIRKYNLERKSRGEPELPMPERGFRLVWADGVYNYSGFPSEFQRNSENFRRNSRLKRSEEKLREVKGSEVKVKQRQTPTSTSSSAAARQPRSRPADSTKIGSTWEAYARAFCDRYGIPPTANAKVYGQVSKFIDRVGAEEAPAIAAWYVGNNKRVYASGMHCTDLLLRDAEALRAQWATGSLLSEAEARSGDETQGRGNVWDSVRRRLNDGQP